MTPLRRGLLLFGLTIAVLGSASSRPQTLPLFGLWSGGAQTAEAAPVAKADLAQAESDTAQTDMTGDPAADVPADMPADPAADVPSDAIETPTPTPTPLPTATPTVTPTPVPTSTPTPNATAVALSLQQVVQRSNDQQVQAIATRNLSLVADTATDDRFKELANILQDMLDHKVTGIELLKVEWGPVVVAPDGASAVVTSTETWRVNSKEGTVDDAPMRNSYTLVLDRVTGTWRIKSDVLEAPQT